MGMTAKRANRLEGKEWCRNSISVWSDLALSKEEKRLAHPAQFPQALVERLIDCFMPPTGQVLLDPFAGSGNAILAACAKGLHGIGFEIADAYFELLETRLTAAGYRGDTAPTPATWDLIRADAAHLVAYCAGESGESVIDLVVTSPPYWDILAQQRTADGKATENYAGVGEHPADLGRKQDYGQYLQGLGKVFQAVYQVLKPGGYCVVNVMDLRKGPTFYPLHMDLVRELTTPLFQEGGGYLPGFILDDLLIWDRRASYNAFRPLGYPAVFRINKAHEYLLIFRKPPA
jgi:SAM-dependent methyltransferase